MYISNIHLFSKSISLLSFHSQIKSTLTSQDIFRRIKFNRVHRSCARRKCKTRQQRNKSDFGLHQSKPKANTISWTRSKWQMSHSITSVLFAGKKSFRLKAVRIGKIFCIILYGINWNHHQRSLWQGQIRFRNWIVFDAPTNQARCGRIFA